MEGIDPHPVPGPEAASERELAGLIERVRLRQPEAEAELHGRLRPFVLRRLEEARARRNWFWLTDAEGVVQDVFTQFFQVVREGRFAFEGQRRLEGFLLRTAFFAAMNTKDRVARHQAQSLFDPQEGELRLDLPAYTEAAWEAGERRECLELFTRAVGTLNENRRDVIERTLLGQKVREICAATGRSPASVSGLKFNALVELREKLVELGFLDRCGELFGLLGGAHE